MKEKEKKRNEMKNWNEMEKMEKYLTYCIMLVGND